MAAKLEMIIKIVAEADSTLGGVLESRNSNIQAFVEDLMP